MNVDLEGMEKMIGSGGDSSSFAVSRGWLRAVLAELKTNRAAIKRLTNENQNLRAMNGTTKRATVNGKDVPFPEAEYEDMMDKHDAVMKSHDGFFSSMSTMFSRMSKSSR